jgi:hypothetical protein
MMIWISLEFPLAYSSKILVKDEKKTCNENFGEWLNGMMMMMMMMMTYRNE